MFFIVVQDPVIRLNLHHMNATLLYLKYILKLFCHLHLGLPSGSFLQDERLQFSWQFWYFRCTLFHVWPILHAFMTLIRRIQIIRRLPKGGQPCWSPSPSPEIGIKKKNTDFADMITSNATSHWNRKVTGVLEFGKIKLRTFFFFIQGWRAKAVFRARGNSAAAS